MYFIVHAAFVRIKLMMMMIVEAKRQFVAVNEFAEEIGRSWYDGQLIVVSPELTTHFSVKRRISRWRYAELFYGRRQRPPRRTWIFHTEATAAAAVR